MSLAALLLAAAACTPGGEFVPRLCPAGLPPVVEVVVERQAIVRWSPSDEPPCAAFRPGAAEVRRLFRHARAADPREVHFTLPESACAAAGRVRFADGSTGTWQVERFGLGWLDRRGGARHALLRALPGEAVGAVTRQRRPVGA